MAYTCITDNGRHLHVATQCATAAIRPTPAPRAPALEDETHAIREDNAYLRRFPRAPRLVRRILCAGVEHPPTRRVLPQRMAVSPAPTAGAMDRGLRALQHGSAGDSDPGDESLAVLREMRSLTEVDLSDTQVSEQGIASLVAARPRFDIAGFALLLALLAMTKLFVVRFTSPSPIDRLTADVTPVRHEPTRVVLPAVPRPMDLQHA